MSPGSQCPVTAPPSPVHGPESAPGPSTGRGAATLEGRPVVALVRTPQGWSVRAPDRTHPVGDLIEGLSLTDLVAEEYGGRTEPDRSARRSVRGPADATHREDGDPVSARLVALERTVAQLEHALAARVSTERAIGVLAERHGTSPRAAFETMRRDARSQGRAVHELAREVLDGLAADRTGAEAVVDTQTRSPSPGTPAAQRPASPDPSTRSTGALADGGS